MEERNARLEALLLQSAAAAVPTTGVRSPTALNPSVLVRSCIAPQMPCAAQQEPSLCDGLSSHIATCLYVAELSLLPQTKA